MVDNQDAFGHSKRKAQVLVTLDDHGELTPSMLAGCCGCSVSNIRGVLSRLRRQGMVDKDDGRFVPGKGQQSVRYCITEEGQRVLSHYQETKDIPAHAPPPGNDG